MTAMTAEGTAPHPDARGAKAPLPLGNAPFTTAIAGSMTGPKIPEGIGDSPAHAGPEYPVTTVAIAALDPKLPPFRGDSWHPVVSVAPACEGVPVASGALKGPKLPPFQGD
jgi:hypothetical protein